MGVSQSVEYTAQFPFWCFYYYGGNKSTRRETGRDPAISSPRSFHGVKICRLVHTIAPAQYKKQEERMKKLVKSWENHFKSFFLLFYNILSDCHYFNVINSLLNAFRLKNKIEGTPILKLAMVRR